MVDRGDAGLDGVALLLGIDKLARLGLSVKVEQHPLSPPERHGRLGDAAGGHSIVDEGRASVRRFGRSVPHLGVGVLRTNDILETIRVAEREYQAARQRLSCGQSQVERDAAGGETGKVERVDAEIARRCQGFFDTDNQCRRADEEIGIVAVAAGQHEGAQGV